MQNNLLRKSVAFGIVLVMVAVMFAPVTMNVSATCSGAGSTETFNPRESIPTFVFGNKYWQIGNGYERQDDLIAEEAEFKRIIEKLVQNGETSSGEGEAAISFRMEEITVGEHPRAPPCENGCGANGWKAEYVAFVVEPQLLGPIVALLSTIFDDSCNRHDRCYCHGYVTYCKDRDQCDDDFLSDMTTDCIRTFCIDESCVPWCCEPATFGTCITGAGAFYGAVHLFGEDPTEAYYPPSKQTCYDYDELGGEWECPAENPTTVYVDGDAGCPQHGTEGRPVSTVARGREMVAPGGTVIIAAGSYPETLVIDEPMTLQASGGTVVIGE